MPIEEEEEATSKRQKVVHPCTPDTSLENGRPVETVLRAKDEGIQFKVYTNDGRVNSNLALVSLKNIFSKQLPKMPKEYIVRLVFDRRHYTVAILLHGRIIGGVCYRPYREQRFAEIAFLAISGTEQVKGYGTLLMNHLKNHVQKECVEYFLTYADNYAIGYFQKQGFSKHVVMPKDRWSGFIKDYDGGTLMECFVHPAMDYLRVPEIIAKQRAFIFDRLQARATMGPANSIIGPTNGGSAAAGASGGSNVDSASSSSSSDRTAGGNSSASSGDGEDEGDKDDADSAADNSSNSSASPTPPSAPSGPGRRPGLSTKKQQKQAQLEQELGSVYTASNVVYDGLELFRKGQRLHNVLEAPGVMSAGWKSQHLFFKPPFGGSAGSSGSVGASERDRDISMAKLTNTLRTSLDRLVSSKHSWPFLEAVSASEVPTYYEEVKVPMDMAIIANRLRDSSGAGSSVEPYFRCREMMYQDLMLVVRNCKQFNVQGSEYYTEAEALEVEICDMFSDVHAYVTAQEPNYLRSQATLSTVSSDEGNSNCNSSSSTTRTNGNDSCDIAEGAEVIAAAVVEHSS